MVISGDFQVSGDRSDRGEGGLGSEGQPLWSKNREFQKKTLGMRKKSCSRFGPMLGLRIPDSRRANGLRKYCPVKVIAGDRVRAWASPVCCYDSPVGCVRPVARSLRTQLSRRRSSPHIFRCRVWLALSLGPRSRGHRVVLGSCSLESPQGSLVVSAGFFRLSAARACLQ